MNALRAVVQHHTITALAPAVPVSKASLSRYLRGERDFPPEVFRRLVHQLISEEWAMENAARKLREAQEAVKEYQHGRLTRERLDRYLADAEEAIKIVRVFTREEQA